MAKNKDKIVEQADALKKGYITLKEAAQISDYSPDYIGQLIRAGKLEGMQVYSNVAWVTTADALQEYLNNKGKSQVVAKKTARTPDQYIKLLMYVIIGFLSVVLLVFGYILSVGIDRSLSGVYEQTEELGPSFTYE